MKFYWTDLIESACRQIEDPAFAGKLYDQFEQQKNGLGNRVFEKANSGLVFKSFQLLDPQKNEHSYHKLKKCVLINSNMC